MSSVEGLRADIVWEANTGQAIADLGAVGEEYSRTTGAMSDQALRLAAAQDRLNASIQRAGPESRSAKVATLAYRNELAALAAEADAASAAVTRQAEAQARAADAASKAQVANSLAAARSAGRALTTYVTAPTVIAGAVALKLGLDFEDSMRLIQTQAGASAGEVTRLSGGILDLVHSGQSFGQTANDMAKGLFAIESEGVRGAKALEILRVAAAGAAVGQTDLAQTANALTSVMRIYGLDANQAAGAMATLNAAVGAGKLHMEDLNAALATKFLPTAKQLGITLPQALAALDVFTRAGIPANTAANNLTTSFIKMEAAAHGAAAGALDQLGLSTSSLANDLQRGGLPAALADLVKGYDALEKSQGKVAANQAIFASFGGSRSGAPILALVQQYKSYLQGLDQAQKQANPATFWKDVAATMNLPALKIREDVAKITADFVKVGVVIAPIAAHIAGDVEKIASAFGHLPGPIKDGLGFLLISLAIGGPVLRAIVGTIGLIDKIGGAFKKIPVEAGPAIAKTDGELASVGTTAGASGAEADAAFAGVGASADRAAGQVELLVVQEGRIGRVAITSGAEAEGAFAGMRVAAVRALGPIAVLLGAVLALNELQNAVGSSGPSTHGAKPNRPKVFEKNGQYYESVLTPRGVEYVKISKQQARQIQQDVPYDVPKGEPSPRGAQAQRDALRRRDRQRHRRDGGGGGGGGDTSSLDQATRIQLQVQEAQLAVARGAKGAHEQLVKALDAEIAYDREQEAKLQKLIKERKGNVQLHVQQLEALQADEASALGQLHSGSTKTGGARRRKDTAADQTREGQLEAQVTAAQSAEQSARTVKAERDAYERERKARLLLLALYEREAHDPALTASQRASAEKKAAAERKKLAALSDQSREDQLNLAVLEAQNAVAKATVGTAAYDKAAKAEDKALAAEIAYYDKRSKRRDESLAARKKDIAKELALRKQKAALDKTEVASAVNQRAEQKQLLAALADIISKFAPNATPLGGGRTDTHLYEAVHELRQIKGHTGRLASSGRFPASDQQMAAAGAV